MRPKGNDLLIQCAKRASTTTDTKPHTILYTSFNLALTLNLVPIQRYMHDLCKCLPYILLSFLDVQCSFGKSSRRQRLRCCLLILILKWNEMNKNKIKLGERMLCPKTIRHTSSVIFILHSIFLLSI